MNKDFLTKSEYKGQPGYKEVWQYRYHNGEPWSYSGWEPTERYNFEQYSLDAKSDDIEQTRRIYVPIEAPLPAASEQGEKLNIAHLAPYLPYGLKMVHNISPTIQTLIGIHYEQFKEGMHCLQLKDKKMLTPLSAMKPVLKSLLEVKGNKEVWLSDVDCSILSSYLYDPMLSLPLLDRLSYNGSHLLIRNHFDVFGLLDKGLAINFKTL